MKKITAALLLGACVSSFCMSSANALWPNNLLEPLTQAKVVMPKFKSDTQSTSESKVKSDVKQEILDQVEEAVNLPKYSDYRHNYRSGTVIGHILPEKDYVVAGVTLGATFKDIMQSLGKPTSDDGKYIQYGGLEFGVTYRFARDSDLDSTTIIIIKNRDATTARGIAVGDSLAKVYKAYGRPDYIERVHNGVDDTVSEYWFYGRSIWATDNTTGIRFYYKNNRVTEINIF